MAGKMKDLSGQIFSGVLITGLNSISTYKNGSKKFLWNCVCPVCKKPFVADGKTLRKGDVKRCKECRKSVHINDRYGRLTVIKEVGKKNGCILLECLCDCGNTVQVKSDDLRRGNTQSCGCLNKEIVSKRSFIDLSGKTFGYAYVNKRIEDRYSGKQRVVWYECRCLACGKTFDVRGSNLSNGHTISCGCKRRKSKGETFIEFYLNKMNVAFKHNFWFDDLRSEKNSPLHFDFAILDKSEKLICLIEFQGEQHYKPRPNEIFGKYQREVSDRIKKEYCETNAIKLFEITYEENIVNRLQEILKIVHYDNTVPSSQETA